MSDSMKADAIALSALYKQQLEKQNIVLEELGLKLQSTQQQLSDTEKALEKEKDKVAVAVEALNIINEYCVAYLLKIVEALNQLKDD